MDDDEMFEHLDEQFKRMPSEETMANAKVIENRWMRFGGLIQSIGMDMDTIRGVDWLQTELKGLGVDISALLLLGLRIAISKDEPPTSFTSTYVTGYVLGYLSALEDRGETPFEELEAAKPEEDEGDGMPIGALIIESRPIKKMSIDEIGEHMREAAREVGQDFTEPDDDWQPIMLLSSEKQMTKIGFDIPGEEAKDLLFGTIIPQVVKRQLSPTNTVGFCVSAWTLMNDENKLVERPKGMQIKDHPDAQECLMLYLMDRAGETQMWTALILRDDEHPPGLDEWKLHDLDLTTGRVADMLRKIVS